MKEQYKKIIEKFGNKIKQDIVLAPYTTYKIGGPADLFFDAQTKEELCDVIVAAHTLHIPYFLLGGGTNILVGDKGFRGLVIKNNTNQITVVGMKGKAGKDAHTESVYVEADSGVLFNRLVRFTVEEGLGGLEMHLGLPGSVGGAIYMNSKWMQKKAFVGDVVHQGIILDDKNTIKIVPRSYFQFQYGKSFLQESTDIVLSVVFSLTKANKDELWKIANESVSYRQKTQPQGFPTAGCVFKNISLADALSQGTPDHTTSTGRLIDVVGLKGKKIGDAEFSPVHANFIVNHGHATANDVIELMQIAKKKIQETFGITLTEEIQKVGEF